MPDTVSTTTEEVLNDIERELDDGTTQTGVRSTVVTTTTQNLGDRVVDVALAPFARTIWVIVTCENLRPDQDYYKVSWNGDIVLDELDVEISFSNFVSARGEPIGLTSNWDNYKGSTIINAATSQIVQFVKTDSNGYAQFAIQVPEGVHIGDSVVQIENESDIYEGIGGKRSRANAVYRAHGLLQQTEPTIVTTQTIDTNDSWNPPPPPESPPQSPPGSGTLECGGVLTEAEYISFGGADGISRIMTDPSRDVRIRTDLSVDPPLYVIICVPRGIDPLAQSFTTYNASTYISSVDLWFRTKSSSTPIVFQIREMINGFPGPKIVPGSTIAVNASDINISTDSSVSTQMKFTDPVFMEANTTYCFVIKAYSTDYELWSSELGEIDIVTGNRIDRQPVLGSLFTSQNDVTWTPEQNFDLKFRMNSCNFSSDGSNEFINFKPMTGADAYTLIQKTSQMILGNNQIIHPNTDIRWYYRFDRTTEGPTSVSQGLTPDYKLFQPGVNLDLQNLTSQILLRMEFSGGTLSPLIDKERTGIVFLKNLNEGSYITRTMEFSSINPENLRPNKVRGLFLYKSPTNTTISVYMAVNSDIENDSDINWRKVVDITSGGGAIENGTTTFTVDTVTDTLVIDDPIGFYIGQPVTFSGVTGAAELTGTKYVRPETDTVLKLYNSQADAENDVNQITISAGSGTVIRSSFARYNESVLPKGWTEAQFDYDFSGILPLQQAEGINQFKFKIQMTVDEGFEAKTPLVGQLRLIATRD